MPTIKIDTSTGIEYSPTDGLDSSVKLHNFIVGSDGSLYKMPVLQNIKNTLEKDIDDDTVWPFRLLDFKKFHTSTLQITPSVPVNETEYNFHSNYLFRRFVYLTGASYGAINIDYDGKRIPNEDLPFGQEHYGEFEYEVYKFEPFFEGEKSEVDLSSLHPEILIDFNAQFNEQDQPFEDLRCVFPMQHQFQSRTATNYQFLTDPRNVIYCSMRSTGGPDVQPLSILDVPGSERTINDLARGCVSIGNRMFFYSGFNGKIFVSAPNDFSKLAKKETDPEPLTINPTEEIQSLTEFNGNIIAFTPTGIDRWVLASDDKTVLQRDPTFHFDHRTRWGGSYVKANRDLYYYTDNFHVYRLNSNLTVDTIFNGTLPIYKPLEDYLIKDETLPMAYFEMIGYRFISVGPWLYNLDSNTWSTYNFDGWKDPEEDPNKDRIYESSTSKNVIAAAEDDIVCTYSTICRSLTYEEMNALPDGLTPTLTEEEYQWGEIAFFTTRMVQDEKTFSLDGIEVYVGGGVLKRGSKMWMQILRGSDQGDFDENDESTYGIPAFYEPILSYKIGDPSTAHVGKFIWRTNTKTDRFRLQFITKEMKGMVVQSVMGNITNLSDSQKFINFEQQQQQKQKEE